MAKLFTPVSKPVSKAAARLNEHKQLIASLLARTDEYVAFADGSCLNGNPGYAGSGASLLEVDPESETADEKAAGFRSRDRSYSFGKRKATNNVAELKAVELALTLCAEKADSMQTDSKQTVITGWSILTDSSYVVGLLQNNWTARCNGMRVAALRTELRRCEAKYRVGIRLIWIKGHVGLYWNEHVDRLARDAAEASRKDAAVNDNDDNDDDDNDKKRTKRRRFK